MTAGQKMSVLVIDDDQTMRNAIVGILAGGAGTREVVCAENGLKGWRALEERPFDVVLVDWMMPIMDGYNFVKTVRRDPRRYKTKIIMVTSKKAVHDVSDAMNVGITSYIIKPFEKDILIKKIEHVIASPRISPKCSEHQDEADRLFAMEEYGKALNSYSKALDVVPACAEIKLKLVTALLKKFEYDKAYIALSEMMKNGLPAEHVRASSSLMVKLGNIDFEGGKYKESTVKYREAVTADPGQIEGYVGLGDAEQKLGNKEAAKTHYEKADSLLLDIGDDDITMLNNIAIRHRRSGRARDAVKILENALKQTRQNPYILYNLGRAYLDLQQPEYAEACFKDAIKLSPDMEEAKEMLRAITGGER